MHNHASVQCPYCDALIEHGDVYCDSCGQQLPEAFAAISGTTDDKGTQPMAEEVLPGLRAETFTNTSNKQRKPFVSDSLLFKIIGVILGSALVLVVIAFIVIASLSNKESVVTWEPTTEDLIAAAGASGHVGFINSSGKMLFPATYDDAQDFYEGYAPVKTGSSWGLINQSFEFVLIDAYKKIGPACEGMLPVSTTGTYWGFIKLTDVQSKKPIEFAIQPQYDRVGQFNNGLVPVVKNNQATYLTKTGQEAIPNLPAINEAWDFSNGMAAVRLSNPSKVNEPIAIIDQTGKILASFPGDSAGRYSKEEGLIPIRNGKKTYYYDRNFVQVLGPYENGGDFVEGIAGIESGGNLGFIDKTGKTIIPCKYSYSGYTIHNGVIHIYGGVNLYLNFSGKVIWKN